MSSFSIDSGRERATSQNMNQLAREIERTIRDMERVQFSMNRGTLAAVSRSLGVVIQKCRTNRRSLLNLKWSLDEIILQYERAERSITGARSDHRPLHALAEIIRHKLDEIRKYLADYLNSLKGKDSGVCEYGGDPINFSTGNFVLDKKYLELKGHFPMSFTLSYNSLETRKGQVGTGWDHNFRMRVEKGEDKYVLHCGDGREETFLRTEQDGLRPLVESGSRMEENEDGIIVTGVYGITYVFDPDGRISRMKARHDGALDFTYDEKGRLQKARSTSGEELRFTYEGSDSAELTGGEGTGRTEVETALTETEAARSKLIRVSDHTGRSVELSYKGDFLTGITDELGNPLSFDYDGNGFLSAVTSAEGAVVLRNEYDDEGRVLRQHFPNGGTMQLDYDRERNALHVTEQNGNRITYVQDELFRNVERIYENGKIRTTYDHRNRKTSVTDKKGNTTRYAYDEAGRMTGITNPLGEEMLFTYNEDGLIEQARVGDQVLFMSAYDDKGNLTERADGLGRMSSLIYNEYGRPVKIIQPDESEILLEYDERGNITQIHAPFEIWARASGPWSVQCTARLRREPVILR